jgi:hypothetical protein
MQGTMTVAELIDELSTMPQDAVVMIPVIKYPGEFALKATPDGEWRWDLGTDVEVVPLERDDITQVDGQCWLAVELTEYNEERAMLNGSQAGPG